MAVSSLSLILPSLSPKTISLAVAKLSPVSLSPSLALSLSVKSLSVSSSRLSFSAPSQTLSSRFVCNVALSEELEEDDVGERGFSPDLKLFVGNLPFNVDSAQLAEIFEGAGNVEMVEVIYDKETGRSRGFGFVTMSTAEEVEAAVQQFNGYEVEGRPLRVNSGPPPPKRDGPPPRMGRTGSSFGGSSSGGNRVYVGNLSWGVDDMALETLFSEQGRVVEAKVVYDRETGRSRGFGFVTYSSATEVDSAVESLNGADLDGRAIRVSVAEARPPRRF